MAPQRYVTEEDAQRLRGDGNPDMEGYKDLLRGLPDGQVLRVAMGGLDSDEAEKANFRRAAGDLGIGVGFSKIFEDDNVPYLLVTRNPDTLRPHFPDAPQA